MLLTESVGMLIALAACLSLIHLVAEKVPFSSPMTRERWLSAGAGVSIVYVFVVVLPKIGAHAEALEGTPISEGYFLVFCGLAAFFGVERIAREANSNGGVLEVGWLTRRPVFWAHIAVFVAYNTVIGYMLVDGRLIDRPLPYAIAMGLHLFGIDEGLRGHHNEGYHRIGRWLLAGSVLVGAGLALTISIDPATQTWMLALLAGGIIFNAIKEELPEDQESSFWAFIIGAGVFSGVVTLIM